MALLKTAVSGSASASAGTGASASRAGATRRSGLAMPGNWEPTVAYLLILTVTEIVVVAWLSRHLLK